MPAPRSSARIHASPRLVAAAAREPAAVLAETGRHTVLGSVATSLEAVTARATACLIDGAIRPLDATLLDELCRECDDLGAEGFRVLAVATRDVEPKPAYGRDDQRDLVLRGYVAFLDPPKDSARAALAAILADGVAVKVLTGDGEAVSRRICHEVGLDTTHVLRDDVDEGRKVFANILKEIRMGASSNFGNVLSVLGASVLLPFVPLGRVLGFVPLPGGWWPVLGLTVAAYVVVVHAVKARLVRRGWID